MTDKRTELFESVNALVKQALLTQDSATYLGTSNDLSGLSESTATKIIDAFHENMRETLLLLDEEKKRRTSVNIERETVSCPECRSGKCVNCSNVAFNYKDEQVSCPCNDRGHNTNPIPMRVVPVVQKGPTTICNW